MNYIHNVVYNFMKDHGLKPMELFRIDGKGVSGTGFFTEKYDFHTTDTYSNHRNYNVEAGILMKILAGDVVIIPVGRYAPTVNDLYYHWADEDRVERTVWKNSPDDYARYTVGNCFRTENEAKASDVYAVMKEQYENRATDNFFNEKIA